MKSIQPIALLTDFGLEDHYVGVLKGVIYKIIPYARIIDITHNIPPGDIQIFHLATYNGQQ
jgi:S-adenosylmethionine hydrolase